MTRTITDLPTKVLRIRADARVVYLARDLVDEAVDTWGIAEEFRDDMKLVLTELVTNATQAAPAGSKVVATVVLKDRFTVRFNVWDSNTTDKVLVKEAGLDDVTGRGLFIVTALSSRTGVFCNPGQGGKWVWAEMAVKGRPADLP